MKIICIGDSLTCGFPFPKEYSWPELISKEKGWEMLNFGVNGESSDEILERVVKRGYLVKSGSCYGSENKADKAIIMGGSNDFIYSASSPLKTLANILQIALMCKNEGIHPIIIVPTLCNPKQARDYWMDGNGVDYDDVNEKLIELNQKLKEACNDFGFGFFDLQSKYKEYNLFDDGLHPTKEGYKFIADCIKEELI